MIAPQESSGLTPIAIPEAKSSQTGVSVRYALDAEKQWYVLRAPYGRQDLACDLLVATGNYAYVPKQWRWREVNGRPKRFLESLIPSLVFTYLHPGDADLLVKNSVPGKSSPCPQLSSIVSFYYDHFEVGEGWLNPPLTVGNREMENFILATKTQDENLVVLKQGQYHFRGDEEVRVTQGAFRGVMGRVVRARGQQRVLVHLHGVGNVATAYIPSAFLEIVK